MDLTQEATWEELGRVIIKHWPVFDGKQSSDKTLRMVVYCAEMKLKIRLAQQRTPAKANTDMLSDYEAMMAEIFAAGDAAAALPVEESEDDEDAVPVDLDG